MSAPAREREPTIIWDEESLATVRDTFLASAKYGPPNTAEYYQRQAERIEAMIARARSGQQVVSYT